jgi:hypothetical protein
MNPMTTDISSIAGTIYDSNGLLEAQVTPIGRNGTASSVGAETYHPYGFIGRPADPVNDAQGNITNGCHVLFFYEGNTLHCLPLHDPRYQPPALPKGGSAQYGSGGSYTTHDDQGNCVVKVPSGKKITIQIAGGPSVVVNGTTVQVGDNTAQALALGAALQSTITALNVMATSMSALAPAATPATFAAVNALGGALTTSLAAIVQVQTTKAMGT